MTGLPDWVERTRAAARAGWHPVPRPSIARVERPSPGDLRAAQPMDAHTDTPARIVVVLDIDTDGTATVALVTDEHDAATADDVTVYQANNGAPFPVTLELRIVGQVFLAQLGPPLGRLELADAIATGRRGLPVVSDEDPRWEFKERELHALRALTTEATRSTLEDERPVVDPALVTDLATDAHRFVRVLDEDGRPRVAPLTARTARRVHEAVASAAQGPDELLLVQSMLMESLAAPAPPEDRGSGVLFSPHRHVDAADDELRAIVALRAREHRHSLRLITERELWSDDTTGVAVGHTGERRVQLILETA